METTDTTECLLEARHKNHGNNWDSDYCGREPVSVGAAKQYVEDIIANGGNSSTDDSTWESGWEFRILVKNNETDKWTIVEEYYLENGCDEDDDDEEDDDEEDEEEEDYTIR
jgi:hypothetical protein